MSLPEVRGRSQPSVVTRPKIFFRLRPPLLEHELGAAPFCDLQHNTITYTSCIGKTMKREVQAKTRFDHVFPDTCSQADVFARLWPEVEPLLDGGRTATVMMYGSTGSGKTHTMEGHIRSVDQCGLCVRLLDMIFKRFDDTAEKFVVGLKFVQVYNRRVDDLLSGQKGVEIQSLADGGSKHVKPQPIKNVADFLQHYEEAASRRTTAANKVHNQSSRSHCILQVTIKWIPKGSKSKRVSVLNLVDLAGSERYTLGVNPTKEERLRSEESIAINQGLTFLATVVDQLVKKARLQDPKIAINFRNHNLTKLLASSLRGEGALCLVLCAPNVVLEREENLRTISFGLRCLKLPVQAKRNVDTESTQVQELIHTQCRQKEDLEHDTALYVEGQAHGSVGEEGGVAEQLSNKEEVEQVQQDLASVRMQRVEHDLSLAGGNRNLVTLRFELEQGRKELEARSANTDKALLEAAEKRLAEREQEILRLESYAGQLHDLVQDLSARRGDYEQLRAELEAARQRSRERETSEQHRQSVRDLEAELEKRQLEIDEITASVQRTFSFKQELESSISSFLQLLERRSTAERSLESAQQLAASLAERQRMANLSLEVEGTASASDAAELRAIAQDLSAELEETERQMKATQQLIQELSRQVDCYLAMLPPAERETVRRYVQDFRRQAPALHKLREEESHFQDELTRSDPSRSVGAPSVVSKVSAVPVNLATAGVDSAEQQNTVVGFDLHADLIHIETLKQNDELKRLTDSLPETSTELRNFFSVYPSFVPTFVEQRGLTRIAELMQKTRHNSTKGNLSLAVAVVLADPCAVSAALESGLVDTYREWFAEDNWTKIHQQSISNALEAVKALTKADGAKAAFREGSVLERVLDCVMNSRVQRVVQKACGCLGELCPNVQQLQEACGERAPRELCGALVAHFYDGSQEVVKAAAECTAQLCNNSKKFKRMFMSKAEVSQMVRQRLDSDTVVEDMDCLDHAIAKIDDEELQDAFALVLLSLILGCGESDARARLQRVPDTAKTKVYEALAFFHATRMRDQDSVFVTSKSKEFPYQGRIFRGEWDAVSAGGDSSHTSYHRNPMYKLHVGSASHLPGTCAQVSIVILHLDQKSNKHSLARAGQGNRQSWAYVDVVARKEWKEQLTKACVGNRPKDAGDDASLERDAAALDEAHWQDGLKPVAFHLASHMHRSACGIKAAATFDLETNADYVLIPHTNTSNVQGRFLLAVISQAPIAVEKLSDELSVCSFAGTINSDATGGDFHMSSWRNGPQLSLWAHKDCIINAACCYRDQDDALSELYLHTEEDRPWKAVTDQYADRPPLQLSLTTDDRRGTRRFVGQQPPYRYGNGCLRSIFFLKGGEFYSLSVSLRAKDDYKRMHTSRLPIRVHIVSSGPVQCTPVAESAEWFTFSSLFAMNSGESKRAFELVPSDASSDDDSAQYEVELRISVCQSERDLQAATKQSDSGSSSSDEEVSAEEDTEDSVKSEPDLARCRICCCKVEQQGRTLGEHAGTCATNATNCPSACKTFLPTSRCASR